MSKPTIIMISHATADDGVERLNASLADRIGIAGRLTRVDPLAPNWDSATAVHIGSFNHLDEPLFMRLVRDAGWRQPDRLQVFIDREDDDRLTEYDLFDELGPRKLARLAIGRGVDLPAPLQQVNYFDRLRLGATDADEVAEAMGWTFDVLAIHPSYFLEADARVVPYDNGTALDTSRFTVSPVDLAFAGVGVRWGSRRPDILDYVDQSARAAVDTLNPGDRVRVDGLVRPGPHGTAELSDVRSVVTLP